MPAPTFPPNLVIDVHDLATIILDCHARTEERFRTLRLVEINHGTTPTITFADMNRLLPPWASCTKEKTCLVLRDDHRETKERLTLDTFARSPPKGVRTPSGHQPTRKELEDAYWRCKVHLSGYGLAFAAQEIIAALPATTKLVVRTAKGLKAVFTPADVTVGETIIDPRRATQIVHFDEGPGPHFTAPRVTIHNTQVGIKDYVPWPWLVFGQRTSVDNPAFDMLVRYVLDLGIAQIGGHGTGGEHFALEREAEYTLQVLQPNVIVYRPPEDIPRITLDYLRHKHDEIVTDRDRATAEKKREETQAEPGHLNFYRQHLRTWIGELDDLNPKPTRQESKDTWDFGKTFGKDLKNVVLLRLYEIAAGKEDFCRHCGKCGASMRCSKCRSVYYCDAHCQKAGWRYHRVWC